MSIRTSPYYVMSGARQDMKRIDPMLQPGPHTNYYPRAHGERELQLMANMAASAR